MPEPYYPPQGAVENAARGLRMRRRWGRGGTLVGVARARDLANARGLSERTVRRMAAFERHRQNSSAARRESDGGPTAGRIAWLLWGGDEGVRWARNLVDRINRERERR